MAESKEVERVEATLAAFFEGLDTRDTATIREMWHPDARLFLNSASLNTRSLSFLMSLPELVGFDVSRISHIDVRDAIATARVDYSMPIGAHSGFFNLVKAEGRWLIASWVDHGTVRRRGNQDPLSNLDNST